MSDEKLARAIHARSRRNILKILCKRKRASVHEIAKELNLSESLTSRHLKMLYDLRIIDSAYEPPEKFYSLKIKQIKELFKAYDKVIKYI